MTKSALVCGAAGFIGGHLVRRLKREGFWVRGVDLKFHEFSETEADDFVLLTCGTRASCCAIASSLSTTRRIRGPFPRSNGVSASRRATA